MCSLHNKTHLDNHNHSTIKISGNYKSTYNIHFLSVRCQKTSKNQNQIHLMLPKLQVRKEVYQITSNRNLVLVCKKKKTKAEVNSVKLCINCNVICI